MPELSQNAKDQLAGQRQFALDMMEKANLQDKYFAELNAQGVTDWTRYHETSAAAWRQAAVALDIYRATVEHHFSVITH